METFRPLVARALLQSPADSRRTKHHASSVLKQVRYASRSFKPKLKTPKPLPSKFFTRQPSSTKLITRPSPMAAPEKPRPAAYPGPGYLSGRSSAGDSTKKRPRNLGSRSQLSDAEMAAKWGLPEWNPVNWKLQYVFTEGDSHVLGLPWGGQLSWARQGRLSDAGQVWIRFHGTPGCRLEGRDDLIYCEEHGIRVISIDRDGYGNSVLGKQGNPSQDVYGFMNAVDYLLDYLGIHKFKVVGVSGGGSYVLPAAHRFPKDRLLGAAIMCGVGHPGGGKNALLLRRRTNEFFALRSPLIFRLLVRSEIEEHRNTIAMLNMLGKKEDMAEENEIFKQGSNGYMADFSRTESLGGSNWRIYEQIQSNGFTGDKTQIARSAEQSTPSIGWSAIPTSTCTICRREITSRPSTKHGSCSTG